MRPSRRVLGILKHAWVASMPCKVCAWLQGSFIGSALDHAKPRQTTPDDAGSRRTDVMSYRWVATLLAIALLVFVMSDIKAKHGQEAVGPRPSRVRHRGRDATIRMPYRLVRPRTRDSGSSPPYQPESPDPNQSEPSDPIEFGQTLLEWLIWKNVPMMSTDTGVSATLKRLAGVCNDRMCTRARAPSDSSVCSNRSYSIIWGLEDHLRTRSDADLLFAAETIESDDQARGAFEHLEDVDPTLADIVLDRLTKCLGPRTVGGGSDTQP